VTSGTVIAFAVAAALALADWWSVRTHWRRVEFYLKPAVMLALIAAALMLTPALSRQQTWFVAALALSLVGDVLLVLRSDRFSAGLAAFLLAHLAYIAGFWTRGLDRIYVLAATAFCGLLVAIFLSRILQALMSKRPALRLPVALYGVTLAAMGATAIGTRLPIAMLGAALFITSDTLLAWNRFVRPLPTGNVGVMVTYHLAQFCLVLSLI
jgi:uncharacterized membrane protein YhhN